MTSRLALAVVAAVFISGQVPIEVGAAGTPRQGSSAQQPQPGMQDMMKMHEQMMAEMKKNRATLDVLMKQMNSASGAAKVDAMAAVIAELVRQHDAMYARMSEMHGQMMSGRGMTQGRGMMQR